MARSTLPHELISSRGVKLDLVGQSVTIVYSFRALALVEEHFGSVGMALASLTSKNHQATSTAQMLACGLAHEVDAGGAPLSELDALYPLLDSEQLGDYQTAIVEALANAVPAIRAAVDAENEDESDPTKGSATQSSPGNSGSTSRPSSSDEATANSGA